MYSERSFGDVVSQERRGIDQPNHRVLGHVVQCDGSRAVISATIDPTESEEGNANNYWTVGKMISINLVDARTVGIVYDIRKPDRLWEGSTQHSIEVSVELVGEVRDNPETGAPVFDRGITTYPCVGAVSHRIRARGRPDDYWRR